MGISWNDTTSESRSPTGNTRVLYVCDPTELNTVNAAKLEMFEAKKVYDISFSTDDLRASLTVCSEDIAYFLTVNKQWFDLSAIIVVSDEKETRFASAGLHRISSTDFLLLLPVRQEELSVINDQNSSAGSGLPVPEDYGDSENA